MTWILTLGFWRYEGPSRSAKVESDPSIFSVQGRQYALTKQGNEYPLANSNTAIGDGRKWPLIYLLRMVIFEFVLCKRANQRVELVNICKPSTSLNLDVHPHQCWPAGEVWWDPPILGHRKKEGYVSRYHKNFWAFTIDLSISPCVSRYFMWYSYDISNFQRSIFGILW